MRASSTVVSAGLPDPEQSEPFLPGPTFATGYHLSGDPQHGRYGYGRDDNPTWTRLENGIGDLEGGEATVFGSGMAAVTAVLLATIERDKAVVVPSDGYYRARMLAVDLAARHGAEVRTVPTNGCFDDVVDGASLVLLETPSNPELDVCSIPQVVEQAHRAGAVVAVDNTTVTVLGQQPLALGADASLASDSKALTGHSDVLMGHVATRSPKLAASLRDLRRATGAIPGPMEAWLAHRSLATLDVRLERQCRNAQAIAELLAEHPAVRQVRYPGLASDPSHAVASRQMSYMGPVVSFVLDGRGPAERFLAAAAMIFEATSFGGVHTTAERRARWGGDAVAEGFIRLSAGIEDTQDLLDDVTQALDQSLGGATIERAV